MASATEIETKPRGKRGDGPLVITYGDAANKNDHKRVPESVTSVIVTDKTGKKSKTYSVEKLSPAIRNQLAALALSSKIKVYVNNSAEEDGSDAIECADEVYKLALDGKLYARGEGKGGPGRTFDPSIWVESVKQATEMQAKSGVKNTKTGQPIKAATDAQLEALRTKLMSMAPKERTQEILKFQRNPIINLCYQQLKAAKAKEAAKGVKTESIVDELF